MAIIWTMYINLETFYNFFEFATNVLKFSQHYEILYKKVDVHKLNTLRQKCMKDLSKISIYILK